MSMTVTLRDEVEQLINQRGKMTRTALYGHFELVAKRAIDTALEDLARTRRIVLGATEAAPPRAAARVFGPSRTPSAPVGKRGPVKPGQQTVTSRVMGLFEPGTILSASEIIERLPDVNSCRVREALMRLKQSGDLENQPRAGYWLPLPREEAAEA